MTERKFLTEEQKKIVAEFVEHHGLDASQISFEGNKPTPIFDYEAISALSLKLADISNISVWMTERTESYSTAQAMVTLPDGKTRSVQEIASINEKLHDGSTISTQRLCDHVAMARATRRAIRSVGVNLYHAHKKFMETGEVALGHTNSDPRLPDYQEIKTIVGKLGWSDETYRNFIADNFEGKTSQKDLNDLELQRFKTLLRSLDRAEKARQSVAEPKQAA